jgi:hypothetical protein
MAIIMIRPAKLVPNRWLSGVVAECGRSLYVISG